MLKIKSINSFNIEGIPLMSNNLYKRLNEYKEYISNNIQKEAIKSNELVILNIQGLYAYRVGLIGWVSNYITSKLSKYSNPTCIKSLLNVISSQNDIVFNDFEFMSLFLSLISRAIPVINIKNWDPKENLFNNDVFKHFVNNISKPSIFNLSSIYLMQPLFDSGLGTYSNKKPTEYGFEKWKIWDRLNFRGKLFNKGMAWSYFESEDKKNGIMIINIELESNLCDIFMIEQLNQLVSLIKFLKIKFIKLNELKRYETFVTGNFGVEFKLSNILEEINYKYNIIKQADLEILCDSGSETSTHFIMYNKVENENFENKIINTISMKILNDEIINVDFISVENTDEVAVNIDNIDNENNQYDQNNEDVEDKKELEENNFKINIKDEYFNKNDKNNDDTNEWQHI
jgi:hypothetical protein